MNVTARIDDFFERYEDVDMVVITSDGQVLVEYQDERKDATETLQLEVEAILKDCPHLTKHMDSLHNKCRIVLVRSEPQT